MNNRFQNVDLYSPILATRKGKPPLLLKVGVQGQDQYTVEGPQVSPIKAESYVLLSALPEDLKRKVETAVQALLTSI